MQLTLQGAIEGLYNLTGDELRTLAWEALLISDGPDKPAENAPTAGCPIEVAKVEDLTGPDIRVEVGFDIRARDGWLTASPTMKDTPCKY